MSDTKINSTATLAEGANDAFVPDQHFEVANREALPFRHVKYMGHGGSAAIEMVSCNSTTQVFALKRFMYRSRKRFEESKHAFKNEVRIMKQLSSHTHIVQFCGTYMCDKEMGIIMSPAADGGDLAACIFRVLDSGIPTKDEEIVMNRAFGCLAKGLAYIHNHRIRHKDIKPPNILIHNGRVIYTDFGISFDAEEQDSVTTGHPGVRTWRYCAPEVQDWGNRGSESDVFALGCVFLEILDALEQAIGIRAPRDIPDIEKQEFDKLPYHKKISVVRRKLAEGEATEKTRTELLRICHDMVNPNQEDRLDTDSVLRRIEDLGGPEVELGTGFFCDDCSNRTECKDMRNQEHLTAACATISLNTTPKVNNIPLEEDVKSTTTKAVKKHKKQKAAIGGGFGFTNNTSVTAEHSVQTNAQTAGKPITSLPIAQTNVGTAKKLAILRATVPTSAGHVTKSDTKRRTAQMNVMIAMNWAIQPMSVQISAGRVAR
ncbi:kinase-like domain-containing protein [Clohesyomyces aquaticus]|uniref:Kinase-like domain-containing protein n=1 Tax=Clohesyomyces aquaticus TaxID=1231657 RepID=A0A1Y2A347_9PLEO|nr:kinase-like domain-containing protein [Clohesyomyces aquaticus]